MACNEKWHVSRILRAFRFYNAFSLISLRYSTREEGDDRQAPFGHIGQPEGAARLIAFLVSDAAEWITGQIIHSRGGF
ncbi:hypothetical protein KSB_85660 [Ktedonobacter robiniae]|uniref:Uncharacterized protein n=1 Tax=Ktedonobacter robiniae TaxID=2778365 RepID=A0ABQ3V565_9CHLR|nr:hypothetical protein KSB_85660 [Ktedonobacter robiniae]